MMNKKLILFAFITINTLWCISRPDERTIRIHRNVPEWSYIDESALPFILSIAALFAKDTEYQLRKYHIDDLVIFKIYNDDCAFYLLFNIETRKCIIEFNACDDSFDFDSFRKMVDFFFIDN